MPNVGIASRGAASGELPASEPGTIGILFVIAPVGASGSYSYVSRRIVMGVSIFVIDVLTISFMDPTLLFKMTTGFISRRSPLLLFLSTMIFTILFIVISSHPAN